MDKKEYLNFLKKDRSARSEAFQNRLAEAGFQFGFGSFGYWDGEPCVIIGHRKIFLTEMYSPERNNYSVRYRMQNDVIQEIREAIAETKEADQDVEDFFDSIEK